MKVPFLNLKATYLELQQELDAAYRQSCQWLVYSWARVGI